MVINLYNRIELAKEFAYSIKSDIIKEIILFGSVARGEDNEESDIDILIVTYTKDADFESIVDFKVGDFMLEREEVISPYVMTEDYFNKTKEFSFLQNVLHDGIII